MQIQDYASRFTQLMLVIRRLSLAERLALCFAFLGSCTLGFALYLQLHPQNVSLPIDEVRAVEQATETPVPNTSTSSVSSMLAVDVSGAVVHPGVYTLAKGERVSDAVAKAGGFTKKADTRYINKTINLAQLVADAMKIYVPFEGEGESEVNDVESDARTETTKNTTVNVNTASVSDLDALKGIGAARAQQIVNNRPYTDLDDFSTKSGLSASLIADIKEALTF